MGLVEGEFSVAGVGWVGDGLDLVEADDSDPRGEVVADAGAVDERFGEEQPVESDRDEAGDHTGVVEVGFESGEVLAMADHHAAVSVAPGAR